MGKQRGHGEDSMGRPWGHHGDSQQTVRRQKEHGGETVGKLQTTFGMVRLFMGTVGDTMGTLWEHHGVMMGTHWGNWGDQWDTLDTLWGHF